MAQRKSVNVATLRYVPNKLLREEYALPMVQRGRDAAMRGCTNGVINGASHMAQLRKVAIMRDVPTNPGKEEFVSCMAQG
jgi:hypothetical protein